jgi:hypothetical protein
MPGNVPAFFYLKWGRSLSNRAVSSSALLL